MARSQGDGPLVQRAKRGDEAAWSDLYVRHGRRLVVWLASLPSGDAALAPEDVASEAWLVAAAKVADFTGSDDDFGGWLVGIARNTVVNHQRRSARRRTNPSDDLGADRVDPAAAPEAVVAEQDAVRRLLAHLSPREAEVVACIDVAGLDVAATARALDMSATAVRVARHRALGRLRKHLGEE